MIELMLPFPPSINSYYKRSHYAVYLSANGRRFKKQVKELVLANRAAKKLTGRLRLEMIVFAPNKRTTDIDNRVKATQDALQDAQVFIDDEQIDELFVKRGEIVKNGVALVRIIEL